MSENKPAMPENQPVIIERSGGNNTAIVALVVILVLVVVGWFFLFGPGANKGTIDVNVNLPSVQVPGATQ
ncbi:MAG: hypothetical protein ACRDF7_06365 [Candidatus Limnocylindrales bacterium]